MQTIPKCFLLPVDGTKESLRPAGFIGRLYPPSEVRLILSYFSTPMPPAYSGEVARSNELMAKKKQFFDKLKQDERSVFDRALEELEKEGFSKELIQEHVEPKGMSVARQECLLGDMTNVDAIVVQKHVKNSLEDLMRLDPSLALVQQCIECPIWMTEGKIDPEKAAIYITDEEASMRIADHAGYMLSDTGASITLIRPSAKTSLPVSCRPSQAASVLSGHASTREISALLRGSEVLADNGITEDRILITLIPDRGDTVAQFLSWCGSNGIGIIGLGRTRPKGLLSFLKTSAAQKITSDFKDMAVWVA